MSNLSEGDEEASAEAETTVAVLRQHLESGCSIPVFGRVSAAKR
jgi:hypothetical protein